jgi:hypothetical protein
METVYNTVYNAVLIIVALAFVLGLALYIFQDKLIYQPNPPVLNSPTPDDNPEPYRNPGDRGIPYENVNITTADRVKLHAWYMRCGQSQAPTVVYFQANAGNMGFRMDLFERIVKQCRVNIFAVSYRGYGFSEGIPTEKGLMEDADAALKHVFSSNMSAGGVYIMGASLGGAVSIYAAAAHRNQPVSSMQIKGVIIENTFTSLPSLVDVLMPAISFLKSLVLRNYWPSLTRIPHITAPILMIAGTSDELIPHAHMKALRAAAQSAKYVDWFEVEGGEHNTTWQTAGDAYTRRIRQFMDRTLSIQ